MIVPSYFCRCCSSQPTDLGVKVVRRLIEQQDVGLLQQQTAQSNAAFFTAGKALDERLRRRAAKRVHRHLKPRVEVPRIGVIELFLNLALPFDERVHLVIVHRLGKFGVDLFEFLQQIDGRLHGFFDDLLDGLCFVELRLLFEIADRIAFRKNDLAVKILVGSRDDPQQAAIYPRRSAPARRSSHRKRTIGRCPLGQPSYRKTC